MDGGVVPCLHRRGEPEGTRCLRSDIVGDSTLQFAGMPERERTVRTAEVGWASVTLSDAVCLSRAIQPVRTSHAGWPAVELLFLSATDRAASRYVLR